MPFVYSLQYNSCLISYLFARVSQAKFLVGLGAVGVRYPDLQNKKERHDRSSTSNIFRK